MAFCTNCGATLRTEAKFCPSCGTAQSAGAEAAPTLKTKASLPPVPPGPAPVRVTSDPPGSGPAADRGPASSSSSTALFIGLAVAAVLAVVVGALVLLAGGSDETDAAGSADSSPSAASEDPDAEEAPATTAVASPPPSTRRTTSTTTDPEAAALQELGDWVARDASVVESEIVDQWVPQVSAKKIGVEDRGIRYDSYVTILDHFRDLQAEFGDVRLLRSTDYSSFDFDGYFVLVVDAPSFDGQVALNWCFDHGLVTNNDCYAKLVSNSLGPEADTNLYPEG